MALQIDGPSALITVPQSDLTPVGGGVYVLDTDAFRLELRDWEDSDAGMVWTKTHNHNTESALAGVTFARQIVILQPWTVTFEDTGLAYTVQMEGSNNNLLDGNVLVPTPLVSYVSTNSAGLIVREQNVSGLTPTESAALLAAETNSELARKRMGNRQEIIEDLGSTYLVTYDDDGTTELERSLLSDADDNPVDRPESAPIKRGVPT